jgi:adenylate cyclase
MRRGRSATGAVQRWLPPLILLLSLVILQALHPDWSARLEGWTVDARFWLRGPEEPQFPTTIVALDEASFQMLGNLQGENIRTWPRRRWADLVERIAAGRPALIGLDVAFDTPGWDDGGDAALAQALDQAGNVVLAAHLEEAEGSGYGMVTFSPPISPLLQAAVGMGVANLVLDPDGSVRRVPLLYPVDEQALPSFPLALAFFAVGSAADVEAAALDAHGTLMVRFRGPEATFETVSAYRLLLDVPEAVDPAIFRDRIVLIGYTTRLEGDRHRSPFAGEEGMPGVEIQANAVDTLLAGDWLYRPPRQASVALVGLAGLGALGLLNLRRPTPGILLLLGGMLFYLTLGVGLFVWKDLVLPLVAPMASAVGVGGVALAGRTIFAEREKRLLRQRFAGVMSPERLRAVLENWETLLQADRAPKEAAVLFADVRGFTHASETLMHQGRSAEMVRFLSAYLDGMSEAAFAEGGVIYDVVGDGLMVLFGLPEPDRDFALHAVRAALRMAEATRELQALWPLRDERPFGMGIGIHCGPVIDAVVGRGRRINYAVVGDPVNTAARIQDHCKAVMGLPRPSEGAVPESVTILLSADLHARVRDQVVADEGVPPFEAHGKTEPLRVVRLLGLR